MTTQTKYINKEEFKKDINSLSSKISNTELLKKYGFKTNKEMFDYARINNLLIIPKQTKEDKIYLDNLSRAFDKTKRELNL